jgi:dTDP-4-amino-4,6-dideoxygalactose transaminase
MKIEVYSPTIRRKEMDAVLTAMVEEKIGVGERNRLLIQTAKEHLRFDYALALRSPAVALHLALKALNAKSGQAVLISALSPRYYLQVIEDLQLMPLLCDVSFDFPCISRETIENAIAKKPQDMEICAIVLHHTLGFLPDSASAAELGIPVIEDMSQSYGSWFRISGKKEGESEIHDAPPVEEKKEEDLPVKTSGVFCILGLEERDMLTSGGGALLFAVNRKDGAVLKNFAGIANEYCLPDINAALAVVQFKEALRNIERRKEIAHVYTQAALRTRHKRFIPLVEDEYNNYSFSLVLETGLKDVIAYARKKEIIVESAFESSIAGAGLSADCPVSSSLSLRTVLFPLYPRLRSQDADRVSKLVMTLP